jgi:transposase InsO family protein
MIESMTGGESQALVLVGEPGVGKTALLEHALESARDLHVARTAARSPHQVPPLPTRDARRVDRGRAPGRSHPPARDARAGRPQTNGNVEALHKTILDECWRPAFARYIFPSYTGLRRELDTYLRFYNHDRVHHGRLTQGRIPADIVYGARKMETR